jgi:acetoin utilization protein AcuA
MFRPAEQQKRALLAIASQPQGAVVAAIWEDTVVGYATFHLPDPSCRWANVGLPVLELGALEVASAWRFMRIGRTILEAAFSADVLEEFIVFSTEYCWHWDLEATRLSVWEYRKLLYAILENVGLVALPTDDPEVMAHPANMLTVRCGAQVPPTAYEAFRELARGAVPEAHQLGR